MPKNLFFVWVDLSEHKWVILAERRGTKSMLGSEPSSGGRIPVAQRHHFQLARRLPTSQNANFSARQFIWRRPYAEANRRGQLPRAGPQGRLLVRRGFDNRNPALSTQAGQSSVWRCASRVRRSEWMTRERGSYRIWPAAAWSRRTQTDGAGIAHLLPGLCSTC